MIYLFAFAEIFLWPLPFVGLSVIIIMFFFFKNMFPLFSSKLPHSDRVLHIHYISGRDKIKNLCHLHDRPEKPASHLNIAKN